MIYLLHISDLHLVANPLWNNMKHAILNSVRKKVQNVPVGEKLLVITGDLHNFVENNYDRAAEFLPQLFKEMGIEAEQDVFVIPGNHDVTNSIPEEIDRKIIIQAVKNKPELLHGQVEKLVSCYDSYIKFVKSISIYEDNCNKLPVQVHVRTWRDKLHILHLNTALVSEGGEQEEQLTDVDTATSDGIRNKLEIGGLPCIALGHHSFFDLADGQQEMLSGMFQQENISAYLCGDRHQRNKTREENFIPLSFGISSILIPQIVSYRTSADEKDQYSDFGMIWHNWDEKTGHVELEFMKWDVKNQGELQPDGKASYDFRGDLCKIQVPAAASAEKGNASGWLSEVDLIEKGSIPVKPSQVRGFLLGRRCVWNVAFSDGFIVERNIVNTIYECALDGGVYALTGPGGEGKSTALMQMCVKLIRGGRDVFYFCGRGKLELFEDIMKDSVLVVDNPPDSMGFKHFLEKVIDNGYTLILGVRENEWNLLKESLKISGRDVYEVPMA